MVLPDDVTRKLSVAALFGALRLSAPEADLGGGGRLGGAPSCGALDLAVDHRLGPPLALLRGGGTMDI
jgi:hypothetical protein